MSGQQLELEQGENNATDVEQSGRRIQPQQPGAAVTTLDPSTRTKQTTGFTALTSLHVAPDSAPSSLNRVRESTSHLRPQGQEQEAVYPSNPINLRPVVDLGLTAPGQAELPPALVTGSTLPSDRGSDSEREGQGLSNESASVFEILNVEDASPSSSGQESDRSSGRSAFMILDILPGSSPSPPTGEQVLNAATQLFEDVGEQVVIDARQRFEIRTVSTPSSDEPDYNQHLPIVGGVSRPARTTQTVVKKGHFPSYNDLSKTEGFFIYATDEFSSELRYMCPSEIRDEDFLGKGGFGIVIKFIISGKLYAVKLTEYRPKELNLLSMLDHENVIKLLGVMPVIDIPYIHLSGQRCRGLHLPDRHPCFLFMPLARGDLNRLVITEFGPLKRILDLEPQEGELIMRNEMVMLEQLFKGLKYLHQQNVCHRDLKASNILVYVLPACHCADVVHCCCNGPGFVIKISDFDSAKESTAQVPATRFSAENRDIQFRRACGTPGYRPPELIHPYYYEDGKWRDVWAAGVIIEKMVLGREDAVSKIDAHLLANNNDLSNIEALRVYLRLPFLWKIVAKDSRFARLALLAEDCLTPNPARRPTVEYLLREFFVR